ncbi:hypothetical protein pdam_00025579 [Pocillopora damicornis]|uniref:CCHC-type domain-containing protein n=1 Tax=Pocillopora damicornis TaxID=46731 RepID=A0A3M6UTZ2_POCDA|nr:hypothetical protein pdam_00025579 [Pocillopora damicornis]
MVLECVKTCVIHASELVASYEKARVIELLRECLDFEELSAIQFCPRGLIRVTFKDAADKEDFVRVGSLTLDGHDLSVTSSDKPYSFVYVHYFPVEGDDALIRDELGKYGEVINIKHQSFSGIPGLLTGSRVLTMVLSDPVPAEFRIDDYPVRICKISGHKAADCRFNGKCRRCGSPDHKAHACARPWGQSVVPMEVAVPVVVPGPPETVVPAVSDSSAILDETVVEDEAAVAVATEDEAVKDDEVTDVPVAEEHQSFSRIPGLLTGSRILTMVLSDPVPAEFRIDDYPVRVWYKGIPPFCQICKISGHKAAYCQFNGKCRRCGSPDHKAHACVRPWGQSAVPMEVAVPEVVAGPSGTVVSAVSDSSAVLEGAAALTTPIPPYFPQI